MEMMNMEYGYCRISTPKQSIERQVRNIQKVYPQAHIVKEVYTGTKFQGRKEFDKILRAVSDGDTIIFDSVSRMSRTAEEGFSLYQELFRRNINLVFLKEPHINTSTYKQAIDKQISITMDSGDQATDDLMKAIIAALNQYILALARKQILLAFEQSEKEVTDLHQRTQEGIETARLNGKQIGQPAGAKLTTKKSIAAKEQIVKYSKDFEGTLDDAECIRLIGVARGTYYKYKRELREKN
jgi:DNA invertase Pin-like site-specific DNA recombinase